LIDISSEPEKYTNVMISFPLVHIDTRVPIMPEPGGDGVSAGIANPEGGGGCDNGNDRGR
jgi:hypothetical protein